MRKEKFVDISNHLVEDKFFFKNYLKNFNNLLVFVR